MWSSLVITQLILSNARMAEHISHHSLADRTRLLLLPRVFQSIALLWHKWSRKCDSRTPLREGKMRSEDMVSCAEQEGSAGEAGEDAVGA